MKALGEGLINLKGSEIRCREAANQGENTKTDLSCTDQNEKTLEHKNKQRN